MAADDTLWSRWDDVDRLLAAALDVDASERSAYVIHAAGDDVELRELVVRLLERLETDRGRTTGPSSAIVDAAFGEPAPRADLELAPGRTVDRYVIVRRRARGGMATVYEAERSDGAYRQRVALKVLRAGLDTEDLVRRFLTERQILSSLSHPNIARLLDGGSTSEGRPYLVMELVDGEPITAYADRLRLDLEARLRLFLQVADAVHAAHQRLVVHRDIKPSNILVDGAASVKLLDFGIARLLGPEAEHTRPGAGPLTPDYASPEQIRGDAVTTATDVYQLGLLLRELVTGVRPLAKGATTAEPPLRPSRLAMRRLAGVPPPEQRAADRGATAPRLGRALAGDLDAIVARATRPEPERRYPSADELAADVRRHLAGLPIAAVPESLAYRLRKLVRRNPWGAVAAAIALVALVGYAVTITVQSRRIALERDRATQEASKAERVSAFLVRLFESADPSAAQGERVTARELLDRGVAQVDHELAGEPAVRAAKLAAIGQSYVQLGLPATAEPLFERTLAERRRAGGAGRDVAADLNRLAGVVERRDGLRALDLFQQALDLALGDAGPADPLVGRILTEYAVALGRVHHGDPRADSMLARAVAILRAAPGDHRDDLAFALTASAYGKPPEVALPLMREGLALRRSVHGDLHAATARSLSDLALATERVDPLAADSLMGEALAIMEALYGRRHGTTLLVMNNLAGIRRDRGAFDLAIPLYREVLAFRRELYPESRGSHAWALYGLGLSLAEAGDAREGERHLRAAHRILREVEQPGSVLVPLTEVAIGHALARQRRFAEAEQLMVGGHRQLAALHISPPERRRMLERIVRLYHAWKRPESAAPYEVELASLELPDAG